MNPHTRSTRCIRALVAVSFVAILVFVVVGCTAGTPGPLAFAGRDVFVESPRVGVRVVGCAFYTRAAGTEMMSCYSEQSRSDTADVEMAQAGHPEA